MNVHDDAEVAAHLHYPTCWDTVNYPTLEDAIHEVGVIEDFQCSVCGGMMEDEKFLELWRGMPTHEGWTMNDMIVQFGRLVESSCTEERIRKHFVGYFSQDPATGSWVQRLAFESTEEGVVALFMKEPDTE